MMNILVVLRRKLDDLLLLGMSNIPLQIWAFSLVRKISQELLELEPHNLMNRSEVMRK